MKSEILILIGRDWLAVICGAGFLAFASVMLVFGPIVWRRWKESPSERKRRKLDAALMKYVRKM